MNDYMENDYAHDPNEENAIYEKKKKHKGGMFFFLIVMVLGIVAVCIGGIWTYKTDMSKYIDVTEVRKSYDADNVTDIAIDYVAGHLVVEKSNDSKIHIIGDKVPTDVEFEVKDKCFKVSSKSQMNVYAGLQWMQDDYELVIQLPEKIYNSVDLDLGAGKSDIRDIHTKSLKLDMGAGQTNVNNIKADKYADVDCGVGQTNFSNCTFSSVDFDCGVGELNFSGKIQGNAKVDSGVGSCNFKLDDPESCYFFTGDNSNGYGSSNGKYNIDLDNGIGAVTFQFSD